MKYIFNRLSNTIGNAQTNAANKVTGGEYLGWKSWNIRLIVYGIMEIRPTSPERKLEFIPAASQDTPVFGINFKFSKLHFLCAVRAALRPCVRVRVCVCVCVCTISLTPWITFVNCIHCFRSGVPKWHGRVSCCVFTCLTVADRLYLSDTTLNTAVSRVIPSELATIAVTNYSTVLQIGKRVRRIFAPDSERRKF